MKRDEIIRIARECGYWSGQTVEMNDVGLERFAAIVAAAERDACAEILDANAEACVMNSTVQQVLRSNAKAIRARGK